MARNENAQWVTEPVTPYRLARFLSEALSQALTEANGEETTVEIAPQQVYGAVRSKTLKVTQFDSGHMKVTPSEANAFIQNRIDRQLKADDPEAEAEEGAEEEAEASA